ncbi:hypothetical protein [Halosolutus gelatinilyticus]|uniref:hypothetical protein n=1 Tax=Halosolutus gelatinilyticus TaxID=2931975 RepID=UPI001FF2ED07|nr:hypothetical protein [Halosolutus gelatinilyticus]
MTRNGTMAVIGGLSLGSLIAASIGWYRVFSYVAAAFIVAVVAAAAIEQNDGDFDVAPYAGMVAALGTTFLIGLSGIWLLWDPGVTEYSYALGLPTSTLVYFAFIWLAPLAVAIYYSLAFDRIAGEEIVDEIIGDARERQRRESFPLQPEGSRPETEPAATEVTDD